MNSSTGKRKGATLLGALTVGAMALAACGDDDASGDEIGIAVLVGATSNAYYSQNIAAAEEMAEELGDVTLTVFDADYDPARQVSQVEDVVSAGTSVYQGMIIFPLDSGTIAPAVSNAIDAGLALAAGNAPVGPSYSTAEFQVDGMVAQYVNDYQAVGQRQGEMVVLACEEHDPCHVAYTRIGHAWAPQETAIDAFNEVVDAHPHIEVVAWPAPAEGTREGGATVFPDTLQIHPDLHAVVGLDQEILGAMPLFEDRPDIKLIGYGGSRQGVELLQEGKWFAAVLQAPTVEGESTVQAVVDYIRDGTQGEGVDVASTLPGGGVLTEENAHEFEGQFNG